MEENRNLKFSIEKKQYLKFKALLTLKDVTMVDFFSLFFKLVSDEDPRLMSIIEETEHFKRNKLTNYSTSYLFHLFNQFLSKN